MGKIKNLEQLKWLLQEHRDAIVKYIIPVGLGVLILLIWILGGAVGENENIEIDVNSSITADEETGGSVEGADTEVTKIFADIGGEVMNPGVYEIDEGTRLFQLIEEAGGLTESADTDTINQAETVGDGQKIIIGSKDKDSIYYTGKDDNGEEGIYTGRTAVTEVDGEYVVNINLADSDDLQLIPGVGPSTAQKIIDYRENEGNFINKEEIKNVSGIGEKTYEKMKDYITV